jgi:hypothetical protein
MLRAYATAYGYGQPPKCAARPLQGALSIDSLRPANANQELPPHSHATTARDVSGRITCHDHVMHPRVCFVALRSGRAWRPP